MVNLISLNGYWDWILPGNASQRKIVPSSYFCVGTAKYEKEFDLALPPEKQAFLCFDGIAYKGKVCLNGIFLGEMLPYVLYKYDITGYLNNGSNTISVEVEDITADYGPTGGWEDYGGIIRDVYIEIYDPVRIDDIQWLCTFNEDYTTSDCIINVAVDGMEPVGNARLTAMLMLNNNIIYQCEKSISIEDFPFKEKFAFTVENPLLWSPDSPTLYKVKIFISTDKYFDEKLIHVGFKDFKAVGSRFYLNGKDIFLKGVARHEMWGDSQGFTLTYEQIEYDLKLIKSMGANFVRLVHYPHTRMTIELCDRIGLMVTEEPGLWWSDLTDESITTKALEIMRRTILRDRNSPSIIAWILYNECTFPGAEKYLTKGKLLCNSLDPGRLVSAANCLDPKQAKEIFDHAGMDFYTLHPYSYEPNAMITGLEALRGKPVLFTEWGGFLIVNNPNIIHWFKRVISEYSHNRDPKPNLAGMAYWQFNDVYQFSRGIPGCHEGVLTEGLVDKYRNKKKMYDVMIEFFEVVDGPGMLDYELETVPQLVTGDSSCRYTALDITKYQDDDMQKRAWEYAINNQEVFKCVGNWNITRKYSGPYIKEPLENIGGLTVKLSGRPLILAGECRHVAIQVGFAAAKLYFIGQVTFFDGYPVRGVLGEVIANYKIKYSDGTVEVIPLRNGYEISSASMIARTSRINPVAANTRKALTIYLEKDWEIYQACCLEVSVCKDKSIECIEFSSLNNEFFPLLFGITASI